MAEFTTSSKPLSQRIFEKYDVDGSGHMDVAEFNNMLRDQGIYLSEEALALAVMELDRDGDCKISYEEYKAWKQTSSFADLDVSDETISNRLKIADTFERFDADKNGSLSLDELKLFHAELIDCELVTGTPEALLRVIDLDGDGCVQFNELVRYLERAFVETTTDASAALAASVATTAAAAAAAAAKAADFKPAAAVIFTRSEDALAAKFADPTVTRYGYDQLKAGAMADVDPTQKEKYLEDSVFLELFEMDQTSFDALPKWKKDKQKKDLSLF